MSCKLTKSLDNKTCNYAVAGIVAVYLANYYPAIEGATSVDNAIAYTFDTDGYISSIKLPTGEHFYKIEGIDNSISYTDNLLQGGNGAKYRQHTLNLVINQLDIDILKEGDAISLGRYIAIVVDTAGRILVLGRTGGLTAPANGFDYASGAAEADALGWTTILQGASSEITPLLKDITVVTPLFAETVTP